MQTVGRGVYPGVQVMDVGAKRGVDIVRLKLRYTTAVLRPVGEVATHNLPLLTRRKGHCTKQTRRHSVTVRLILHAHDH